MAETTSTIFDNTVIAYNASSKKDLNRAYWLLSILNFGRNINLSPKILPWLIKWKLPGKFLIQNYAYPQFSGGNDLSSAKKIISKLGIFRLFTALHFAAEKEKEEADFDGNMEAFIAIIQSGKGNPHLKYCGLKLSAIGDADLLQKYQSGKAFSEAENNALNKFKARLEKICSEAYDNDMMVMIEGEESWIQEVINECAYEMMAKFNQERAIVYNTYQMYLKKNEAKLKNAYRIATMKSFYLGVKLARGAFWEKETKKAQKQGDETPVYLTKDEIDEAFNKAMAYCLNHKQRIYLCAETHNEFSNHYLTVMIEKHGLLPGDPRVTFLQLYGMGDHISFNLANRGYNVVKYLPYGPVEKIFPYLLRRLEEIQSVLASNKRELQLIKNELKRRKNLDQPSPVGKN